MGYRHSVGTIDSDGSDRTTLFDLGGSRRRLTALPVQPWAGPGRAVRGNDSQEDDDEQRASVKQATFPSLAGATIFGHLGYSACGYEAWRCQGELSR